MKTIKIIVLALTMMSSVSVFSQETESNQDSITTVLKIKELKVREHNLKNKIAVEDAKRNQHLEGVTPETQERLNNKQDSICLDLRSQLVEVELEMKELIPNKTIAVALGQYNELNDRNKEAAKPEETE